MCKHEPTSQELASKLSDVLSKQDCADLANMEIAEAICYAITLLYEAGIASPESYLKNLDITQ